MLFLVLSCYWYRTFIQTYSGTSPFDPHREMDKKFSPNYSSSQITYKLRGAEAVEFSRFRFRFHRKRTASTASASSFGFRFHIPGVNITSLSIFPADLCLLKPWICSANYPKSHKQNVLHSHNFLRIWVALFKYCISILHVSCERKVESAMRRLTQGKAYVHFSC